MLHGEPVPPEFQYLGRSQLVQRAVDLATTTNTAGVYERPRRCAQRGTAHAEESWGNQNWAAEKSWHLSQLFQDEFGDVVVRCAGTVGVVAIMHRSNVLAESGDGLRQIRQHRFTAGRL